ncbi:MAG TPA: DNA cytosine methyltransferase [Solirubrobacteraceae bacterium]|nr:DNA cytosine methyltransferase [Solirubrobacteraceae bacterium]
MPIQEVMGRHRLVNDRLDASGGPRTLVERTRDRSYSPRTLDLFCGAGGLSCGLSAANFTVLEHLDNWKPAVDTLNANFDEQRQPTDIADLEASELRSMGWGELDVMAGGPPCQSFTSAGRRSENDHRGTLVGVYARLVAEVRPPVVVFENVEGFVTAGGGRYVFDLLDPLIEAGYRIVVRKVNLANYGVPQHRKRVIAIGSLIGEPLLPPPTHSAWGAPGAERVGGCPPTPTVEMALAGLPTPHSSSAPQGHVASDVGDTERSRISALKEGQTMRDLPEHLWHESYRRRANRRVMDGTPTQRRGGAPAGLRRLRRDEPSKAITSAAIREFVHPTSDRPLTLREAARLQTFDDSFRFCGTATEQATLVGNAIPPRFATALGATIRDHLVANADADPRRPGDGTLVEFNVTNADAMSPALASVVAQVRDRYVQESLFASPDR